MLDSVNPDGLTPPEPQSPGPRPPGPKPFRCRLLIIGTGPCAASLAAFAGMLDYSVTVCEPREPCARTWNVKGTTLTRRKARDAVLEHKPDPRTAVVALTNNPRLDDEALLEALDSPAFYIGACASPAQHESRRRRFAQLRLPASEIARVNGLTGLDLGGRTPPEIGLSIIAKIIVRTHLPSFTWETGFRAPAEAARGE